MKKIVIVLLACAAVSTVYSMHTNLFRPNDINLKPPKWHDAQRQQTVYGEWGLKVNGYNTSGSKVNSLQLWTAKQNGLAMLKGFPEGSPESEYLLDDLGDPVDDLVRGNFKVDGALSVENFGVSTRYYLPYNFSVHIAVPFYKMRLKNITFADQTLDSDIDVKNNLTSNFFNTVAIFDDTLNLTDWSKSGLGDAMAMVEWYRDFPQRKPILKNVTLNIRSGFNIPTGVKKDEDKILSLPFGWDGSFGIIAGAGIALNWTGYVRGGLDVEFMHLFGTTKERRIKVSENQTDFLFLAKAKAHKEYGFTQRFNIFLEAYRVLRGLSVRGVYQYQKHSEDTLTLSNNDFSSSMASTAEHLQEWTTHNMIGYVEYDFQQDLPKNFFIKPQISLFMKFPLNGKRSICARTVGGTFAFNF